jgi:hypothetical protein
MATEDESERVWMEIYFDESGSRFPDLKDDPPPTRDFFALGGILFETPDVHRIISAYDSFRAKWEITYPLHSNSIRFETNDFTWLGRLDGEKKQEFYRDLDSMIEQQPFVALACVINRPGYNARYKKLYGEQRWMLCKTAFAILIERAAKFAGSRGRRLCVHFEESGKREDRDIVQYQKELKRNGMPFSAITSSKYKPLSSRSFQEILIGSPERHKKSSLFCQLADLILYPIARGKYDPNYRTYEFLRKSGKLVDCLVSPKDVQNLGVKYSCFN